jgi:hypothetical protein
LRASGLRVEEDLILKGGFFALGHSSRGTLRLIGARVGGGFSLVDAVVLNRCGPAIEAHRLQTEHNVSMKRLQAEGFSDVVQLTGARIGGSLSFRDAVLRQRPNGEDEGVLVNLRNARVTGKLHWTAETLDSPDFRQAIVDGLTYAGLPVTDDDNGWLQLLDDGTPAYTSQPYQQLATAQRAAGHDMQARRTLIA